MMCEQQTNKPISRQCGTTTNSNGNCTVDTRAKECQEKKVVHYNMFHYAVTQMNAVKSRFNEQSIVPMQGKVKLRVKSSASKQMK